MRDFNGFKSRAIFCSWAGGNLSNDRLNALLKIFFRAGQPVTFLTEDTIPLWEVKKSPFHPLVKNLSAVHKNDYYRAYFMHHYGGGFTDVKPMLTHWWEYFELLDRTEGALIAGYEELSASAVVQLEGELGDELRREYKSLIGICSVICKPNSSITRDWLTSTEQILDSRCEALVANPARGPTDSAGKVDADGITSRYPFGWTDVGGAAFHPTLLKYRQNILKVPIMPQVWGYR